LPGLFFIVYNSPVIGSNLRPIWLSRRFEPFVSDDFLYELKIGGFRGLLYLEDGKVKLVRATETHFMVSPNFY
jgi:hypothetical protein